MMMFAWNRWNGFWTWKQSECKEHSVLVRGYLTVSVFGCRDTQVRKVRGSRWNTNTLSVRCYLDDTGELQTRPTCERTTATQTDHRRLQVNAAVASPGLWWRGTSTSVRRSGLPSSPQLEPIIDCVQSCSDLCSPAEGAVSTDIYCLLQESRREAATELLTNHRNHHDMEAYFCQLQKKKVKSKFDEKLKGRN